MQAADKAAGDADGDSLWKISAATGALGRLHIMPLPPPPDALGSAPAKTPLHATTPVGQAKSAAGPAAQVPAAAAGPPGDITPAQGPRHRRNQTWSPAADFHFDSLLAERTAQGIGATPAPVPGMPSMLSADLEAQHGPRQAQHAVLGPVQRVQQQDSMSHSSSIEHILDLIPPSPIPMRPAATAETQLITVHDASQPVAVPQTVGDAYKVILSPDGKQALVNTRPASRSMGNGGNGGGRRGIRPLEVVLVMGGGDGGDEETSERDFPLVLPADAVKASSPVHARHQPKWGGARDIAFEGMPAPAASSAAGMGPNPSQYQQQQAPMGRMADSSGMDAQWQQPTAAPSMAASGAVTAGSGAPASGTASQHIRQASVLSGTTDLVNSLLSSDDEFLPPMSGMGAAGVAAEDVSSGYGSGGAGYDSPADSSRPTTAGGEGAEAEVKPKRRSGLAKVFFGKRRSKGAAAAGKEGGGVDPTGDTMHLDDPQAGASHKTRTSAVAAAPAAAVAGPLSSDGSDAGQAGVGRSSFDISDMDLPPQPLEAASAEAQSDRQQQQGEGKMGPGIVSGKSGPTHRRRFSWSQRASSRTATQYEQID